MHSRCGTLQGNSHSYLEPLSMSFLSLNHLSHQFCHICSGLIPPKTFSKNFTLDHWFSLTVIMFTIERILHNWYSSFYIIPWFTFIVLSPFRILSVLEVKGHCFIHLTSTYPKSFISLIKWKKRHWTKKIHIDVIINPDKWKEKQPNTMREKKLLTEA